eukprot:gene10856-7522_t
MSNSERVHVVARVRPFTATDPDDSDLSVVVMDKTHISIDGKSIYAVDRVFSMEAQTEEIFNEIYIEVYGDIIRDLLCEDPVGSTKNLQLYDDSTGEGGGTILTGAVRVRAHSLRQVMEVVEYGTQMRATGATNINEYSSRSHSIFTIFNQRDKSKLHLVDLAGSERYDKTKNVGQRFQESIGINTGLLALGNVIRALRKNHSSQGARVHVPYRSSKLTRLLQDSLGGNSRTVFIACIAPDSYNRGETKRTLEYCTLAQRILNAPMPNYLHLYEEQCGLKGPGGEGEAYPRHDMKKEPMISQEAYDELLLEKQQRDDELDQMKQKMAKMCARVSSLEEELRQDEVVFKRQIHEMQRLVDENDKYKRRIDYLEGRPHKFEVESTQNAREATSIVDKVMRMHGLVEESGSGREAASTVPAADPTQGNGEYDGAAMRRSSRPGEKKSGRDGSLGSSSYPLLSSTSIIEREQQHNSVTAELARKAMTYQAMNSELKGKMSTLEALVDKQRRESAMLRLEVQQLQSHRMTPAAGYHNGCLPNREPHLDNPLSLTRIRQHKLFFFLLYFNNVVSCFYHFRHIQRFDGLNLCRSVVAVVVFQLLEAMGRVLLHRVASFISRLRLELLYLSVVFSPGVLQPNSRQPLRPFSVLTCASWIIMPPGKDDAAISGKSADFLRRRLAQAEMQLREMEAESKRVSGQQQRTIDAVRRENKDYLERIEQIRMDECVENLDTSEGMAAAKVLASKSEKYCRARDLVALRRSEYAEAEAELAGVRQSISDLRRRLSTIKRRVANVTMTASAELQLQSKSTECSRDQLKSLEGRIIHEREELGFMTIEAREARVEIDGCLIEQSRYEKNYAKCLGNLLDKLKEISYIIEVCQLLFEERDHQAWELREVQRIADQERQQYENAFSEITAVLDQNKRQCHENESKNAELRNSINETKVERMSLEMQVQELRKKIQQQLHQDEDDDDGDGMRLREDVDDIGARIKEYKALFDTLADIAAVETITDVVSFPKDLSEKRFGTFKELNHLDDAIQMMEQEKKEVLDNFAALAEQTPSDARRVERMRELREKLESNRKQIEKEQEHLENTNGAISAICSDIETIYVGLDCSLDLLKQRTGMSVVMPATALEAFCIAEQRAQEYLLCLSKKQATSAASNVANYVAAQNAVQVASAIIRRPDLHPRKATTAAKQLKNRELPRTTDTVVGGQHLSIDPTKEDRPLSLEEMRAIAAQRARAPPTQASRREKITLIVSLLILSTLLHALVAERIELLAAVDYLGSNTHRIPIEAQNTQRYIRRLSYQSMNLFHIYLSNPSQSLFTLHFFSLPPHVLLAPILVVLLLLSFAEGAVVELNPSNFNSIVEDPKKNVFVMFYASWCGHCHHMMPVWEELSNKFGPGSSTVIARIEASTHTDIGSKYGVRGFPTIRLFPKNDKSGKIEFNGNRDLQDFENEKTNNYLCIAFRTCKKSSAPHVLVVRAQRVGSGSAGPANCGTTYAWHTSVFSLVLLRLSLTL